jgi:hypothetical protein
LMIRMRSSSSRRRLPTKRSAIALARGASAGVLMIRASTAVNVEGGGELGVAVSDEKPEAPTGVIEVHAEVAGLLGQPGSGGVGGDAEDVHTAGGVFDDEEDVQPAQADGVHVEQVAGEDRVRLRAQEFGP